MKRTLLEPMWHRSPHVPIDLLVSLPPAAARHFHDLAGDRYAGAFVDSDPEDRQLGSGGGTAYLLWRAWQQSAPDTNLHHWLHQSRKLVIHGSGESRRLPAYAACGKPLLPLPPPHDSTCHFPDAVLLDQIAPVYKTLLRHADPRFRLMIACGDVALACDHWIPPLPAADVVIFGMAATPEEAVHHGVMLCTGDEPDRLDRFLQKPTPAELAAFADTHTAWLDTGIWVLSERAVEALFVKCGWSRLSQAFPAAGPSFYDLYASFGPALGAHPAAADPDINRLEAAVIPFHDARFYHFGSSRSLLASAHQLQTPDAAARFVGHASLDPVAAPVVLHGRAYTSARHTWIENSHVPASWTLRERHVLTGIPDNTWSLDLPSGTCVDVVPVAGGHCLRVYGFDDSFRGAVDSVGTVWLGRPPTDWFTRRQLTLTQANIDPGTDLQSVRLFPVVADVQRADALLQWLVAGDPAPDPGLARQWLDARRLSARDLLREADLPALFAARRRRIGQYWQELSEEDWLQACTRHDLPAVTPYRGTAPAGREPGQSQTSQTRMLATIHDRMWRSACLRGTDPELAARHEATAFGSLRRLLVQQMQDRPVTPRRNIKEDQIVWGRSPIRLDLAGGWTDTPPYCLEHGGRVVNVAVDLNGQPPIQVFARICKEPRIVLRSIDLGSDDTVDTYEALASYADLGSGFAIARAALALTGFEPRFADGRRYRTLADQLQDQFGGGIELSMVCAIPKGSGLGTSSILAAALLGTLGELCGMNWCRDDIFARTMALEQMLTSGGGWQDQVGGHTGGVKYSVSLPGLLQRPVVRELPAALVSGEYAPCVLLYYTGITRVAHDILGEIVRGLFLNSARHLAVIREIGLNADYAADAIQRGQWLDLCEAVRRSWCLNQMLDPGTNPPAVQSIIEAVHDRLAACKLLGAGGGGYLLMLARDEAAARQIRRILADAPPNDRARFVEPTLSTAGFRVTHS